MNRRSVLSMILILALALSLAACGGVAPQQQETTPVPTAAPDGGDSQPTPEPTAVPVTEPTEKPADPLMQALLQTLPSIKQDDSHDWRYAVTDLDHNGRLEVLAASQHQADRSTTVKLWEMSEAKDALVECSTKLEEGESFPDILSDNADTFHDAAADDWSYLFYDNIQLSEKEGYTAKCAVTLDEGTLSYETFAIQMVSEENGQRSVSYMDMEGSPIEAEAFNAAGEQFFAGKEKSSSNFGWFRFEDAVDAQCLEDSYAVFTGERTPDKTNPLPLPQPMDQAAPQQTGEGSAPLFLYITKNPTNEKREEGQTAYFVAFANIYTSLSWTFVAPDGGEYTPQSFLNKFPGTELSGLYSTTLSIGKLSKQADRWGAYCTFNYDGQTARTNTAYLNVTAKAAPSPSPAPTVAPSTVPTATPAPTAEPTETPAPTEEPAPTETPAPTEEPAPTETPAPVPTGEVIGKGGFSSQTGSGLELCCDWYAVRTGENQADLTMTVSIRHASIQLNSLRENITLNLGNHTEKMDQPALDYRGGKTSTVFGTRTYPIELTAGSNVLPLNVQWRYDGSYGGKTLNVIECGGDITLDNGPAPTPTPEPEPDPEPIYASMAGTVHDITAARYTIQLANGMSLTVDPSICRLDYGELAEGCSCTVYYANEPTEESIYLVDIYGEIPAPDVDPDIDPEPEPEPDPEPAPEPEPVEVDMTGTYKAKGKTGIEIKIKEKGDGYEITVTWTKDENERNKWVFHGSFDADGKLKYTDCVKTLEKRGENGEFSVAEEVYKEGHGSLSFDAQTGSLTWKDEKEDIAKDLVFEKKA